MQRKIKNRIYVTTFSALTFLFFFALTHVNPPSGAQRSHKQLQQTR